MTVTVQRRHAASGSTTGTKQRRPRLSRGNQRAPGMQSMDGIVTIVQEGRFQLLDDDGVSHLFLLGYRAAAEPEQLAALQHSQARIAVRYKPADGLIGHIAERITVKANGAP